MCFANGTSTLTSGDGTSTLTDTVNNPAANNTPAGLLKVESHLAGSVDGASTLSDSGEKSDAGVISQNSNLTVDGTFPSITDTEIINTYSQYGNRSDAGIISANPKVFASVYAAKIAAMGGGAEYCFSMSCSLCDQSITRKPRQAKTINGPAYKYYFISQDSVMVECACGWTSPETILSLGEVFQGL